MAGSIKWAPEQRLAWSECSLVSLYALLSPSLALCPSMTNATYLRLRRSLYRFPSSLPLSLLTIWDQEPQEVGRTPSLTFPTGTSRQSCSPRLTQCARAKSRLHLGLFLFFFFGLTAQHVRSYLPDQGLNPCPLQWKCRVLTTGRPGKSPPGSVSNAAALPSCPGSNAGWPT